MRIQLLDENLLNEVSMQAKASERLRKNFNFHHSLDEPCHRFINAVEPGTEVPVHCHKVDEMVIILRGRVEILIYDDEKIIERATLCLDDGNYGAQIPAGVYHSINVIETGSALFEIKEGPYVPNV